MKNIALAILFLTTNLLISQEVEMITDWKNAKDLAKKENKQILVILTGSKWCAPCKKMDKKVIENAEFKKYAKQNLIVFLVDLPGGGIIINSKVYQYYAKFKEKYQANYLPSLILTDNSGAKITTLKGKMFKLDNVMNQLKANAN